MAFVLVEWSVATSRILEQERLECLRPLLEFYGAYVAGILSFWYFGRFPRLGGPNLEKHRFLVALLCTLILNVVLLYVAAGVYLRGTIDFPQDIRDAVQIATELSFLVAPVNLYYFGMKRTTK